MKYILGIDIGSSSVKVALLDASAGKAVASAFSPATEMPMISAQAGFAEQEPETWWQELVQAIRKLKQIIAFKPDEIICIGISYQMHGLVCIDQNQKPLRPSIIWCDSRAVAIGDKAFSEMGSAFCLENLLNSPGNFTASKLKWVKENEPQVYEKIHKILLPGDYIAMKLTGVANTTVSGLSEGILWNFKAKRLATELLQYFQIDESLIAPLTPTFGEQGRLTKSAAEQLGIASGTPVSYRAGDQPNNACALNVLRPGEIAATAGTSGVIYGVTDKVVYDLQSRVNGFVHVSHTDDEPRVGVLLCVNGTGILNSWVQKNIFPDSSYPAINAAAASAPVGSDGLRFYPFGNGAERMLNNKEPGAQMQGLQFNRHRRDHLARAAQEGIAFSLNYGAAIMQQMGITLTTIRAGYANMFQSEVFAQTFADATNCPIELYNTDGALGAARAAGVGCGYYPKFADSYRGMELIREINPDPSSQPACQEAYEQWKQHLLTLIQ